MKKLTTQMKRLLVLAVAALIALPILAQDDSVEIPTEEQEDFVPQFELGDQLLATGLGASIPLFFAAGPGGVTPTNLSLGGIGSLRWASYLNNDMSIGAEASGSFSFTANGRVLYLVPVTVRYTYYFRSYPLEFPVHVGLGASVSRLEEATKVDPAVIAGVEGFWNYDSQWAFGLRAQYWFIPQIYVQDDLSGDTRLGNFLSLTAIVRYHI
jgi:hypothetical protein